MLLCRKLSCGKESVKEATVRNTQASEVFRSAFLDGSNNNDRVSLTDLDYLISEQRVRPSALLGIYQLAGLSLGAVTKVAPQDISEFVNDASL